MPLVCSKCGLVERLDPLMRWHASLDGVITCGPCHTPEQIGNTERQRQHCCAVGRGINGNRTDGQ